MIPSDPHALLNEILRHDFLAFLAKAVPAVTGGAVLLENWHIEAIAYELGRVAAGQNTRLIISIPPRSLKSLLSSVVWPAFMLGRDPQRRFVCVSYSNELSAKHARDCLTLMRSDWYRRLFPKTVLSDRSASHDFETTAGGGRLSTSIGGTLTGRGGDIIIIDDPMKPEEAMSETARNAVRSWYASTLGSRLNDKRSGAMILVMQRLHEDDLVGIALEQGGWHELRLSAIAEESQVLRLGGGRIHRRAEGDLLHPEREPMDVLDRLKASLGSANFAAQYQQNPIPTSGNLVQADWLKSYDSDRFENAPGDQVIQSWDTASKDGVQNDWSVCITAVKRKHRIYIRDVYRARLIFPELKKKAIELARRFKASALLIEDAASGAQLIQMLRDEEPFGLPSPIRIKPDSDKETRLAAQSARIEAGDLFLPIEADWLPEFKRELLGFPNSRYADQVDALAQLLGWTGRNRLESLSIAAPIIFYDGEWHAPH